MEAKNLSRTEKEKAVASEMVTEKMIRDVLEQGQQEGVFCPHEPQLGAGIIKAMLQDWYLKRSKHARREVSVDQYAAYLQNFIEAFYLKGVSRIESGTPLWPPFQRGIIIALNKHGGL